MRIVSWLVDCWELAKLKAKEAQLEAEDAVFVDEV